MGKAILLATHAVPERIHLMDHFGHLGEGRILSSGAPSVILTDPESSLPLQFLPDHLVIASALAGIGVDFSGDLLNPDQALVCFLDTVVSRAGASGL